MSEYRIGWQRAHGGCFVSACFRNGAVLSFAVYLTTSCPSLLSLLVALSDGSVPDISAMTSNCGSPCFNNFKVSVPP